MQKIKEAASEFLANRRIAVTGVSREPASHGANVVYKRLRERGYEVFAVNPNADAVEGDPCLSRPARDPRRRRCRRDRDQARIAEDTMRECVDIGKSGMCGCTAAPGLEVSPRRPQHSAANMESP